MSAVIRLVANLPFTVKKLDIESLLISITFKPSKREICNFFLEEAFKITYLKLLIVIKLLQEEALCCRAGENPRSLCCKITRFR